MAQISFKDTPAFVASVKPGINTIVASELSKDIEEVFGTAVAELRNRLEHKFAHAVETIVERAFLEQRDNVQVNVTVTVKDDE